MVIIINPHTKKKSVNYLGNKKRKPFKEKTIKPTKVKKIKEKKPKSKPIITTQENTIVIITEIKKRKKSPKVKLRKKYKNLVWELTNNQDLSSIKNIEKRKFKEFDLDHKISIFYGFHNNIPAHIIAHPSNLRIIPHKENAFKGTKIHIDMQNKWILETLHI